MKARMKKILLTMSLLTGLIFSFSAYADQIRVCLENDWGTAERLCIGGCHGVCTNYVQDSATSDTIIVNNPSAANICDNDNNTEDSATISDNGKYKVQLETDGYFIPVYDEGAHC